MSIPISRPTPQMREPQKFSAFRENVSTNWENHQVSIVTSAALGLAIGAISIVFATTLLTGGAAMILFAVGGMAIVAGLGISTYFTIKPPPKGLDQYRTENITPKVPSINTKKKTSEIPSEKSKTEKELERELRKDSDSEKVRQAKTPSKEGAEEETNSSGIKHPKVSKVSVDCPFEVASTDQQSKRSLLLSNNSQVQNLYSLERSNGEKNGILHSTPHPSRLHPALSSQSFSLVNKHFLELIGKDFDPSQTQGNSFYAYEILEHVVKGNRTQVLYRLNSFFKTWTDRVNYEKLLIQVAKLAKETGQKDLIRDIHLIRSALPPLVLEESANHSSYPYPVRTKHATFSHPQNPTADSPLNSLKTNPYCFEEMEYEKESSWSWRKFTLDIAKVVATVGVIATAGVVYAYYNGYNFELESNPEKELCASQTIKILKKDFPQSNGIPDSEGSLSPDNSFEDNQKIPIASQTGRSIPPIDVIFPEAYMEELRDFLENHKGVASSKTNLEPSDSSDVFSL